MDTKLVDVFDVIASLGSPDECRNFLEEILSPNELRVMVKRWQAIYLLSEGHKQRAVAHRLSMGRETITRARRALSQGKTIQRILMTDTVIEASQRHGY